jgi:hypothetical protein
MKVFARFILILLFLGIACWPAFGSTVIFYVDKGQILAASDGKMTSQNGEIEISRRKIFCVGNVIFGQVGYLKDTKSGFVPAQIAQAALATTNSFNEAINQIERSCSNALFETIGGPRTPKRDNVLRLFNGRPLLQLGFATFENSSPKYCQRTFLADTNSEGEILVGVKREDTGPHLKIMATSFGRDERVMSILRSNPGFWETSNKVAALQGLIKAQIEATSESVGYPIYTIRMEKTGIKQYTKISSELRVQVLLKISGHFHADVNATNSNSFDEPRVHLNAFMLSAESKHIPFFSDGYEMRNVTSDSLEIEYFADSQPDKYPVPDRLVDLDAYTGIDVRIPFLSGSDMSDGDIQIETLQLNFYKGETLKYSSHTTQPHRLHLEAQRSENHLKLGNIQIFGSPAPGRGQ